MRQTIPGVPLPAVTSAMLEVTPEGGRYAAVDERRPGNTLEGGSSGERVGSEETEAKADDHHGLVAEVYEAGLTARVTREESAEDSEMGELGSSDCLEEDVVPLPMPTLPSAKVEEREPEDLERQEETTPSSIQSGEMPPTELTPSSRGWLRNIWKRRGQAAAHDSSSARSLGADFPQASSDNGEARKSIRSGFWGRLRERWRRRWGRFWTGGGGSSDG